MPGKVVVIGAGFGGLSAAAHLAQDGHAVTVLEATDQSGGRARVRKRDGFTFDLGPSWYLMPDVFEEWFASFGHVPEDFYELRNLYPSYRVFSEQRQFDVPVAPDVFSVFEGIEPGSGKKLEQLLAATRSEYAEVRNGLLTLDGLQYRQVLQPDVLRFLSRSELARSYHGRIKQYVQDPDLQHVLEFMTVFMGGSPQNVPAYYSLLTHVDMNMGVRYPMGGFGAVARAFESVAREVGADIRYNKAVTRIEVDRNKVQAVWVGEERFACDAVVANADYQFVETKLLPSEARSYDEQYWSRRQISPSGLVAVIGVKRKLPELQHHNLFFDTDWDRHFDDVFTSKRWSERPLFYACVPSRTDASVAPKGHENMFLLAPMAAGTNPSQTEMDATTDAMLRRIEQKTGVSFMEDIVTREVLGPSYFTDTFNAYKGNAFGLSHTMTQSAVLRPRLQSKRVPNLFYTGQYTNPGTGVPMVIQSGQIAARLVRERAA
jgi:phytoene desaturase